MFYKPNSLTDSTDNIIFFDIDGTLSSNSDFFVLKQEQSHIDFCKYLFSQYDFKTIKYFEFETLSHSSIALFAKLLTVTNSKAVCLSSWINSKEPELFIKELSICFNLIADFPKDFLIGFTSGGGGDRHNLDILPFLDKYNISLPWIAIDDGFHQYINCYRTVNVVSNDAFILKDFNKALSLLNVNYNLHTLKKKNN